MFTIEEGLYEELKNDFRKEWVVEGGEAMTSKLGN